MDGIRNIIKSNLRALCWAKIILSCWVFSKLWKGFVTALCVEMINEKITQKYFKFNWVFLNVRYLEDGNGVLDR